MLQKRKERKFYNSVCECMCAMVNDEFWLEEEEKEKN